MTYIAPPTRVYKPRSSTLSDLGSSLFHIDCMALYVLYRCNPMIYHCKPNRCPMHHATQDTVSARKAEDNYRDPEAAAPPSLRMRAGVKATSLTSTCALVPPPYPYLFFFLLLPGRSIGNLVIIMDNTRVLSQQRGANPLTSRLMKSNLRPVVLFSTCRNTSMMLDD